MTATIVPAAGPTRLLVHRSRRLRESAGLLLVAALAWLLGLVVGYGYARRLSADSPTDPRTHHAAAASPPPEAPPPEAPPSPALHRRNSP